MCAAVSCRDRDFVWQSATKFARDRLEARGGIITNALMTDEYCTPEPMPSQIALTNPLLLSGPKIAIPDGGYRDGKQRNVADAKPDLLVNEDTR
jgi:hypothetical protein